MPLPVPNLDDRDFARLVLDAKATLRARCPEWTDLSPGDPGVTLLELFAYLTETLIYRVNRAPEKAYVQFLNLMGVRLEPPASASVVLRFTRASHDGDLRIPRGTRVTTGRGGSDAPVFVTADDLLLASGEATGEVLAHHGETVDGELLGRSTGGPGQSFTVGRAPISLPTGDDLDLVVGIETEPHEIQGRAPARQIGGTTFRVWTEATHFPPLTDATAERHLFLVDRWAGTVTFAPAARVDAGEGLGRSRVAFAEVPPAGREIRAWYRVGGGAAGNVAAGTLTSLKDPIRGVSVTNPEAATGGRDAETLDNALIRGPQRIHALDRVVTARDYERAAISASGAVSRAHAVTRAELWRGSRPGEVQVFLVPSPPAGRVADLDEAQVRALLTAPPLARVREELERQQPMGTSVSVGWAGLKAVAVRAHVVVHRAEDRGAVERRLAERLRLTLSPVPGDGARGWEFGEELRVSTMYDVLQAERGVRFVGDLRLEVQEVPTDVAALIHDAHQPGTWYCGSEDRVLRSVNDGDGWELVGSMPGERVERLAVLHGRPGVVAATTRLDGAEASALHASADNGDSWVRVATFDFHVEGFDLATVNGEPCAYLATDQGLFRQVLRRGAAAERIPVVDDPAAGCYDVACVVDPSGTLGVAVALQQLAGVAWSGEAGREGTFARSGLEGVDVRVLEVREAGTRRFVYAGAYATGSDEGAGVRFIEMRGSQQDAQGWRPVADKWTGGSCLGIALVGDSVVAATARAGVTVATERAGATWRVTSVESGLPLRESGGGFEPITCVAGSGSVPVLAGGPRGVHRTTDGRSWVGVSSTVFTERVTLPPTWLFIGTDHELTVSYDEPAGS